MCRPSQQRVHVKEILLEAPKIVLFLALAATPINRCIPSVSHHHAIPIAAANSPILCACSRWLQDQRLEA